MQNDAVVPTRDVVNRSCVIYVCTPQAVFVPSRDHSCWLICWMGVAWLVMCGVREGGPLFSRSTTARNATRRRVFMPHQNALASDSTPHNAAHVFAEDSKGTPSFRHICRVSSVAKD